MRKTAFLLAVLLPAAPPLAAESTGTAKVEPLIKLEPAKPAMSEQQQTLYGLGVWLAQKVELFHLTADELKVVESGLKDAALGKKLQVELDVVGPKINELAQSRMKSAADKEKKTAAAYLEKAAAEKGAKRFPSGLIYRSVKDGKGDSPKASDTVKVNYEGKLTNGKVFDSSYQRNQPAEFGLGQVIPCWTEGLQQMKPGGKAALVCPSSIAYGDSGHPPTIPGGATLVFTVELLEIVKK